MPLRCNNQCCHFHGKEVSEELRSVCAKLSGFHGCSACEVVPPLPAASESSAGAGWVTPRRIAAATAGVTLVAAIAAAWPDKNDKKAGELHQADRREVVPPQPLITPAPNPPRSPEVVREEARREVDALVVGGNRMIKMHRALAIALTEADASLHAQDNRTEVGRTKLEISERAKQIHQDGLLFQQAARAKDDEIRDEIETYRKTLDRLAKVDAGIVETEFTGASGTVAGVADKGIALGLAKRHLGETRRYGSLDLKKIFQDFKEATPP